MGSLMAGAPHNRPGGGLRTLAELNRGRSSSWEVKGQWEAGDPCAPGPGGQGRSALDPWGLMAAPAAWTASGCGFPKVRELIRLLVRGTCLWAGLKAG